MNKSFTHFILNNLLENDHNVEIVELQVLCIQCHKNKSRQENETRRLEKK